MGKKRKKSQFLALLVFIFFVSSMIQKLSVNLDFLSPFQTAIENFDVSDYAFTHFEDESYFESKVVLVNLENLDRLGIARLIDSIAAYHPKVIGLDALFFGAKNPQHDFALFRSLKNPGNVVLASKLDSVSSEGRHQYMHEPYPLFHSVGKSAFANLVTGLEDGFRTSRVITPKEMLGDSVVWSFPAELVKAFDADAFQKLRSRNKTLESINWVGNVDHFFRFKASDIFSNQVDLSLLKDKLVIVGYLGPKLGEVLDYEDAFFTPLNSNPVGRAFPDMYGPVIHANAVSMMLKQNYIDDVDTYWSKTLGLIILLLNAFFFQRLLWRNANAFELISRVAQLAQLIIIWAIAIYLLARWQIKIDFSYALFGIVISADCVDIYESTFAGKVNAILKKLDRRKLA
jgi:CHASE2 domain-containing sensor protein